MKRYFVLVKTYNPMPHAPEIYSEERTFDYYPSKAKAEEVAKILFFASSYDEVRVAHKNWNTVKGTKVYKKTEARIDTLKYMNHIIYDEIGDEGWFDWWLTEGIPDGSTEEDLKEIAEDNEDYADMVKTFFYLIKRYQETEKEIVHFDFHKMYLH